MNEDQEAYIERLEKALGVIRDTAMIATPEPKTLEFIARQAANALESGREGKP